MYPRAKPPTPVRQSVDRNAKTRLNLPTHDVVLDPSCRRHHVPLREQKNAAAVRPASRTSGNTLFLTLPSSPYHLPWHPHHQL